MNIRFDSWLGIRTEGRACFSESGSLANRTTVSSGKAKRYNNIKLAVGIGEGIASFVLLLLFVWLGYSFLLETYLSHYIGNSYLLFIVFVLLIGFAGAVLSFPISYYTGFYLEHRYNLSNQSFLKWIWENFKGLLVSLSIGIPILLLFYFSLNQFGQLWWLPFSIIMFVISVVLSQIFPILIFPIFYKITPIEDENLKERITSLAKRARLKVENVYKFNMSKTTKKANAAFTGLGKTKRIILGDTLLDNYNIEEIETVIAHELGHYKKKHILKNILIGTASSFLTLFIIAILYQNSLGWFGFRDITQVSAIPLLALWSMLIGVITTPLGNILSRKFEFEADEYAVLETQNPVAFKETLEKLTDQNLGDKLPHPFIEWFFYSHPSIKNRISAIDKFAAEMNLIIEE